MLRPFSLELLRVVGELDRADRAARLRGELPRLAPPERLPVTPPSQAPALIAVHRSARAA